MVTVKLRDYLITFLLFHRSFEENLKKITPKSEEVENLYQQVQKIVIVSFFVSLKLNSFSYQSAENLKMVHCVVVFLASISE